jgi:hypothetical protein
MRGPFTIAIVVLLAAAGTACKTTRAATPVERPNLEVPPAPPRTIEPPPPLESPPAEPVGELPVTTSGTPTRPRPPRDQGTAKPETKPETQPETPPATPPAPPANPPQLRAPGMASQETAGEIRAILDRANGILFKQIDYRALNKSQRASYDTAKRFAEEGEKELKSANYVLAKELAEKAERLAKELQRR